MKISAAEFRARKNKQITLLGMSGVGKTHLSKMLAKNGWFHYSADYRIATAYLGDTILAEVVRKARQNHDLKTLLENRSIRIENNISFDNLASVAAFLGKVGNPEMGGLPIDEFLRRQTLHKQAEISAMMDVEKFIRKTKTDFPNFVNDAGGSLCEIDDPDIFEILSKHTLFVYLKVGKNAEKILMERAGENPKPLYYRPEFFQRRLKIYLKKHNFDYVAQMNPDDFVRWIFPELLAHRLPKYQALAERYGVIVDSEKLSSSKNAEEVVEQITRSLKDAAD